jgi:methionyl-tRNA synthetase
MEVRKSAQDLRAIWVLGNEYLQSAAPWSTFKTDPEKAAMQVRLGLNLIRVYAVLSAPFIPETAARMLSAMNTLDTSWPDDVAAALSALPAGHEFTVPEVMFAKISDEQREEWQERFAGGRG